MKSTIIFAFLLNLLVIQCGTFTCQAQKKTRTTSTARKQTKTTSSANAEFQRLLAKANKGDAEAQAKIGKKYLYGNGIAKNTEKAEMWLKKAADSGNAEACGLLGDYLVCIPERQQDGQFYLRKGASLGDGHSYYCLFLAYDDGKYGFPKNESLAGQMLIKHAETKPGNYFIIAVAYAHGSHGLPKDEKKAIYWIKKCCDASYAEYLSTGVMPKDGSGWPYHIQWLKELGCDYDPALHVDEYQAWLNDKPTTKTTAKKQTTTAKKSTSTTKYLSLPNGNSRAVITVRQPGQKEQGLNGKISIDKNLITLTPNGGTAIRIEVTGNPSDGLWSKDYPCRINSSTTDGTHKYELSVGTSAGFKSIEFWFKNKYYIVTILDL